MQKHLYETKNTEGHKKLIQLIVSRLSDLKEKIEKMSESEIKNKKLDEIEDVFKKILDFNYQNQEGQGPKILTPDQITSRLPISLAQLKARNHSEKLENEIRQLPYPLYLSKN